MKLVSFRLVKYDSMCFCIWKMSYLLAAYASIVRGTARSEAVLLREPSGKGSDRVFIA